MLLTSFVLLLSGCAVFPEGSIVFSNKDIGQCGFVEITDEHLDSYLRVTNDLEKTLSTRGSNSHQHGIAHTHQADTRRTQPFVPLGLDEEAAAFNHQHNVQSTTQTHLSTDQSAPRFPHIPVRLFQRQDYARCVPSGAIVGFVGTQVPEGWQVINDEQTAYLYVSKSTAGLVIRPGEPHIHQSAHGHDYSVTSSDNSTWQAFRPSTDQTPASAVVHSHTFIEGSTAKAITDSHEHQLPRISLRFIQTKTERKSLPVGSVVGYAGTSLPWLIDTFPYKWSKELPVPIDSINDRFISVRADLETPQTIDASSTHSHTMEHEHTFVASGNTGNAGSARSGNGQPISPANHSHEHTFKHELQTEEAPHTPKHTYVFLLIKQ
ncbi:hypothetical protein A9263_04635 [Vibrio cyclitrophicus]|nr:hypothetical protein A9263_04635 [Vibrio cyclitrophicus]